MGPGRVVGCWAGESARHRPFRQVSFAPRMTSDTPLLHRMLARATARWQGLLAAPPPAAVAALSSEDLLWLLGSFCALNHKPFDPALVVGQYAPPYTTDSLILMARALGFRIQGQPCAASALGGLTLPCVVFVTASPEAHDTGVTDVSQAEVCAPDPPGPVRPAILIQADGTTVTLFEAGTNVPVTLTVADFAARATGLVFQWALVAGTLTDPDGALVRTQPFGFRWFIPELLRHKRVWREVLGASLVIQLLALALPLFTQVIIDRVIVHHAQSTLIVIGIGMALFLVFSAVLNWVRQYLVLHTGNRVDAVLGAAVFAHLLKLPLRYFEHRPTGVITTRLRGVETIREFVAGAAVTLILDLPFLLIFVAIMFYYSVVLTLIALTLIGLVVMISLVIAPIFRDRLNEQYLLGARNQAFATEYIAGLETVKSLQMEPTLNARYRDYWAQYLQSGFGVRQIANTYNVLANGLEQALSLVILIYGAYYVMNGTTFTIGMLVAFQMFAARLSQPILRLVGLWQQFQQARLAVARLGDVMNAPPEPYTLVPHRLRSVSGGMTIQDVSFRYADHLPFLYEHFTLTIDPGQIVAVTGPSGCGKSTLAKLLQGFYLPTTGVITVNGTDIRHLAANELRQDLGVVPQETILFSGTIYDNLLLACPQATFEQVVQAARMAEIHTVIEQLPQGYQTAIGERGAGLSGGQKQRLAIARALLKQPKILIFDEATSSLDSATAEQFAKTINQLKGQVTMLFISHALPHTLQVDAVVALGAGADAVHPKETPDSSTTPHLVRATV